MSEPSRSPLKPIKRIITGHNEKGQSTTIFVDKPEMKPIRPESEAPILSGRVWLSRETPTNNDDSKTDMGLLLPSRLNLVQSNGSSASVVEMPPGQNLPTHRTSSIDYIIHIAGQLTLTLEDGTEETVTEPGSVIVQRGSLHGWENRGDTWLKFVVVMIDAKPVEIKDAEGNTVETLAEGFNLQH